MLLRLKTPYKYILRIILCNQNTIYLENYCMQIQRACENFVYDIHAKNCTIDN